MYIANPCGLAKLYILNFLGYSLCQPGYMIIHVSPRRVKSVWIHTQK